MSLSQRPTTNYSRTDHLGKPSLLEAQRMKQGLISQTILRPIAFMAPAKSVGVSGLSDLSISVSGQDSEQQILQDRGSRRTQIRTWCGATCATFETTQETWDKDSPFNLDPRKTVYDALLQHFKATGPMASEIPRSRGISLSCYLQPAHTVSPRAANGNGNWNRSGFAADTVLTRGRRLRFGSQKGMRHSNKSL